MKKAQWITLAIAVISTALIFLFARTTPKHDAIATENSDQHADHEPASHANAISIDTILQAAKKQLNPDQITRVTTLENSISRGDVKGQQLKIYHQLAHFWGDSMGYFPPYAWYEAEAARLENSEKTLTFAAHLFLDNLQQEQNPSMREWESKQAKDLFERSLKLNPANDSSRVGLGATYLFGNVSASPMEGIAMIRSVVEKDSANIYAQMTLAKASLVSGQLDKAISRLHIVNGLQPDNLEAILMLADVYERTGDKKTAADWYAKSLGHIKRTDVKAEIEKRIAELKK